MQQYPEIFLAFLELKYPASRGPSIFLDKSRKMKGPLLAGQNLRNFKARFAPWNIFVTKKRRRVPGNRSFHPGYSSHLARFKCNIPCSKIGGRSNRGEMTVNRVRYSAELSSLNNSFTISYLQFGCSSHTRRSSHCCNCHTSLGCNENGSKKYYRKEASYCGDAWLCQCDLLR